MLASAYSSLHLMKGIVQQEDACEYEMHCCPVPDCDHVFPRVDCGSAGRAQWVNLLGQVCPIDGSPRFTRKGQRIFPTKRCANDPVSVYSCSLDNDCPKKC